MRGFWNKLGHKFLSTLEYGNLEVQYPHGQIKHYGDKSGLHVKLILHKSSFFKRISFYGDVGFGESYMDGDFECNDLCALIEIALINSHKLGIKSEDYSKNRFSNLLPNFNRIKHMLRKNSKTKAQKNIAEHYDLSNEFFALMLDESMMYSSAIFAHKEESLHDAQLRKIRLLAQKLGIKKGDRVLEIGSGWGEMALHLAKEFECHVTTVTLSKEQKALCENKFAKEGVEAQIEILLKDYRDLEGKYDAIISVEMFEAVGLEFFDVFFKKCQSLLKPEGVLVMQVITIPDQRYDSYASSTDFIQKYIFPGGHLPSVFKILQTTSEHTRFNLLHLEDFTEHYAKTLHIWDENFTKNLLHVRALGFDEYFIRMWKMYLKYCEAGFITRNIGVVQLVFTQDQNMNLNKGLL